MWDAHTRFVTVAHITSESGDHYLETFDGWPDNDTIRTMVFESAPDWWMSPEYVHINDVEQIRFIE